MKKILLLSCIILLSSVMAQAACNGIPIKSGKYCMSKHMMNWYSAYAWCHAQGMQMVDVKSDCVSLSSCPALKLTQEDYTAMKDAGYNSNNSTTGAWTNTSETAAVAYFINMDQGIIYNYFSRNSANRVAVCKQRDCFIGSFLGSLMSLKWDVKTNISTVKNSVCFIDPIG